MNWRTVLVTMALVTAWGMLGACERQSASEIAPEAYRRREEQRRRAEDDVRKRAEERMRGRAEAPTFFPR